MRIFGWTTTVRKAHQFHGSIYVVIPRTYVITLDSLGGPHKQAVNQLAKYLKLEAKDKKGIEQPGGAAGLVAAVGTYQYALLVVR